MEVLLANLWFYIHTYYFDMIFEYVVVYYVFNLSSKFRDHLFCGLRDMMF